jgi:hypothetical protein
MQLSVGSWIAIHTIKKVNLKGGTLIDGFPSWGFSKFNTLNVLHEFSGQRPCFGHVFTMFSTDIVEPLSPRSFRKP